MITFPIWWISWQHLHRRWKIPRYFQACSRFWDIQLCHFLNISILRSWRDLPGEPVRLRRKFLSNFTCDTSSILLFRFIAACIVCLVFSLGNSSVPVMQRYLRLLQSSTTLTRLSIIGTAAVASLPALTCFSGFVHFDMSE